MGEKNSLMAQHCMQNNHKFDFDAVKTRPIVLSGH